jgi:hypothetical protein
VARHKVGMEGEVGHVTADQKEVMESTHFRPFSCNIRNCFSGSLGIRRISQSSYFTALARPTPISSEMDLLIYVDLGSP